MGSRAKRNATTGKGVETKPPATQKTPAHGSGAFVIAVPKPTIRVTVVRSTKGGAAVGAKLNGTDLTFSNDVAHAVVGTQQFNSLQWIAAGPPASSYTLAVTEPSTASSCKTAASLDATGEDAGSCGFNS